MWLRAFLITGGKILRPRLTRKVTNRCMPDNPAALCSESDSQQKARPGSQVPALASQDLALPKGRSWPWPTIWLGWSTAWLRYARKVWSKKGIEHYEQKFRLQRIKNGLKKKLAHSICNSLCTVLPLPGGIESAGLISS